MPDWVQSILAWVPRRLLVFHMTAGSVLLLYAVIHTGWIRAVLRTRTLIFLGQLSFPLYLVHVLVEASLGCYTYMLFSSAGYPHGTGFAAAAVTTLVVSLLFAWVGAMTVEPFSIYLGRRIYNAFFKPSLTEKLIDRSPTT